MRFHLRTSDAVLGLALLTLASAGLSACGSSGTPAAAGSTATCQAGYRVDVLLQAQVPLFDDMVAGFQEGFAQSSGLATEDVEFSQQNAQGDPGNYLSMARTMTADDSDLIAVIGTAPTLALAEATHTKPIISISMDDPVGAGVAKSLDEPGKNITGSMTTTPLQKMLEDMRTIQPDLSTIGTIFSSGDNHMVQFVDELKKTAGDLGMTVNAVSIAGSGDVLGAARSLATRSDALLIGRDGTVAAAMPAVASAAKQSTTPLYLAYQDDAAMIPGVVGGLSVDWRETGRLAGEVAGKVCKGSDPATTPFAQYKDQKWYFLESGLESNGITLPTALASTSEVVK